MYRILDLSHGTATTIAETTAWHASWRIQEVGMEYKVGVAAEGAANGANSTSTAGDTLLATSSIFIPGILNNISNLKFYRDPRLALKQYNIDIFYDQPTFIPAVWSTPVHGGPTWQGIVFYLNQDPNPQNNNLTF